MFNLIYANTKTLDSDKKKLLKNMKDFSLIRNKLEIFSKDPEAINLNIKKLEPKSDNIFRLRIGKYRIIYSIDFGNKNIIIHRIALRKDIYKN